MSFHASCFKRKPHLSSDFKGLLKGTVILEDAHNKLSSENIRKLLKGHSLCSIQIHITAALMIRLISENLGNDA